MKMELKELSNGKWIMELSNYGYLMFEPLAKDNDNQRYSITFKINDAMVLSGRMLSMGVDIKYVEYEMINVIHSMKQTLNNIQNELGKNAENKTQALFCEPFKSSRIKKY